MEQYSSGRRGVTRNLVGHGSVARVQIPAAPPKAANTAQEAARRDSLAAFIQGEML